MSDSIKVLRLADSPSDPSKLNPKVRLTESAYVTVIECLSTMELNNKVTYY